MTRARAGIRPPGPAAWLVHLFASADQAEPVLGDLQEEFSGLVWQSGVGLARRWYWRQSAKTIAHLAGAAIRDAPWSLAGVMFFGFLLDWFSVGHPWNVIDAILRAQRPYSNLRYGFYGWLLSDLAPIFAVVQVVQTTLVGSIVGVLAKGRELVATIVLGILFDSPIRWILFFLFVPAPPQLRATALRVWLAPSTPFVVHLAVNLIALVLGGVIVRMCRSSQASRPALN